MRGGPVQGLAALCIAFVAGNARGDGGTVRLSEQVGAYRITVFTEPTPLRAGPIDVSVLVQDADTRKPVPAEAQVVATRANGRGPAVLCPAVLGAATNRLLHAAHFELPSAGQWQLAVHIAGSRGEARTACMVEVAEPLPRWAEMWSWIGLPILPIVLFVLYQVLHRR
jgi:hypothetical protein